MRYLLFLFFFRTVLGSFSFFIPPHDWKIVDPKTLSKHTVMAFIGEHKKSFCPTINLAIEKVDISQKQYVKVVKKLHKKDPHTIYRDLGKMQCACGTGHLSELSVRSKGADLRMLQFILVKENHAYVITAATLKNLFSEYQQLIRKSIQSFTITDDLPSCISDEKKKTLIKKEWKNLSQIKNTPSKEKKLALQKLQEFILNHCSEMGSFWQVLTIQELQRQHEHSL